LKELGLDFDDESMPAFPEDLSDQSQPEFSEKEVEDLLDDDIKFEDDLDEDQDEDEEEPELDLTCTT
jgi:hypothetical protein